MVWGVVEPDNFGDFFQGGDYVGWNEGIKRYFDEEMSAEQRAAFDNWDVSYREKVSRKFTDENGDTLVHAGIARFADGGKVRLRDDGMIEFRPTASEIGKTAAHES